MRLLSRAELFELARKNPGKSVGPCGCITDIDDNSIEVVPGDLGKAWIVCLKCGEKWTATPTEKT